MKWYVVYDWATPEESGWYYLAGKHGYLVINPEEARTFRWRWLARLWLWREDLHRNGALTILPENEVLALEVGQENGSR